MNSQWRYLIPVLITLSFVILAEAGFYYLIFVVLLLGNLLNYFWGEFSAQEIGKQLRVFYTCPVCIFLKRFSAIFLICFLLWGVYFVDRSNFNFAHVAIFTLATGLMTGCFIVTLAHDTLHSTKVIDRILASALLIISGIPYLAADHIHSHHKKVGLEDDASTAKINQNFYQYFIQVAIDRFRNSFTNSMKLPNYLFKKILKQNILLLFLLIAFWLGIGILSQKPWHTIIFIVGQAAIAFLLYEIINYIQHYGLKRKDENESIQLDHAWNCYYKYTNFILFMLPMHSLHHMPKSQRKLSIDKYKDGPKMPYLYFLMVLMALIPPLWFAKMNPLVQKLNN